MQVNKHHLERIFNKLEIEMVACKHHIRGFLKVDGRRVCALHFSHSRKEMPASVAHLFRKSLRLNVSEFETLKCCSMTRSEYVAILIEKGVVD
jgi:hypothetical protein